MTRTALYRFFDADNQLLYVGITDDVPTRWNTHAAQKRWWSDVTRKLVDWHENREGAEAAEKRAIIDEKPLYNVTHSTNLRPKRGEALPPAALFHARVVADMAAQSRTDVWLSEEVKVPRRVVDAWRTRPIPPQAYAVMAVADALGIDRDEAAELSGLESDTWTDLTLEEIQIRDLSDMDLLMETAKRILGIKNEVEVAVEFMRHARR